MKVKCYKGLKGCDTETIEVEKSAILKNIRNLFIRKEFIELDNRKKRYWSHKNISTAYRTII